MTIRKTLATSDTDSVKVEAYEWRSKENDAPFYFLMITDHYGVMHTYKATKNTWRRRFNKLVAEYGKE